MPAPMTIEEKREIAARVAAAFEPDGTWNPKWWGYAPGSDEHGAGMALQIDEIQRRGPDDVRSMCLGCAIRIHTANVKGIDVERAADPVGEMSKHYVEAIYAIPTTITADFKAESVSDAVLIWNDLDGRTLDDVRDVARRVVETQAA